LDEQQTNDATAKHRLSNLPPVTHDHVHVAPSQEFSPLQDGLGQEGAAQEHGDVIPSQSHYTHPATPPRQDHEIDEILRWHATQYPQQDTSDHVDSIMEIDDATHQYSHGRSSSTPQLWQPSSSFAEYPTGLQSSARQLDSWDLGHYRNSRGLSYPQTALQSEDDVAQARRDYARLNGHMSQMQLPTTNSQHDVLPLYYDNDQLPRPPVQQWSTHSLGKQHPPSITPPHQRVRTRSAANVIGPSPGHDGITAPDKKSQKKKEAFERKAEELRQRRQSVAGLMGSPTAPSPKGKGKGRTRKRKLSPDESREAGPTVPPNIRRLPETPHGLPHYGQSGDTHATYEHGDYASLYQQGQTSLHGLQYRTASVHQELQTLSSFDNYSNMLELVSPTPSSPPPHAPSRYTRQSPYGYIQHGDPPIRYPALKMPARAKSPLPANVPPNPQSIDWDTHPQELTHDYKEYKWSVNLYDISPNTGFDFAQSWLEDLFTTNNLHPPTYKWHAHTTRGFIESSTRTSFLVLHNAADPFELGPAPTSTTSIGVYGRFWNEHSEIHWKTFAPDIKWLLSAAEQQGCIKITKQWRSDMLKASERRFHKAYFMAATMGPIKDLLRHRGFSDPVHDAVESEEEGFEVLGDDLRGGEEWGNTAGESDEAWERVLERNEEVGYVFEGTSGFDHVVIGSSEMSDEC
jgi:hypothetical protein